MNMSPNPESRPPAGEVAETRVRRPLPQVSEPEREFWRRAVDLERRRMAAQPDGTSSWSPDR
ncbi:MAG: hypothetical protein OEW16_02545 [Gammaproteobacteria bacterium]|nr:hypothetical protein [Gammaproteobacteria bacterium]